MTKFGLAQPVRRVEDLRLLKGGGRYADDVTAPNCTYAAVLRSPHAAARILSVDTGPALAMPGVLAAYTSADLSADGLGNLPCVIPLKSRDGSSRADTPRPALAEGAVRHVGDPVVFVVAESATAAQDAAEAILVEYDVLPAATDLATATEPGQPLVWEHAADNVCFDWEIGDVAATDAEFARAAHVTRVTVVNNRVVAASMEARVVLAHYDEGRWTLTTNTQGGWFIKNVLRGIFNVDPSCFRVITPDVGGGFGMKLFLYPEHVLTSYAARKLGRPVKWVSSRNEAFLSDAQGRDNLTHAELALDTDGRFLAMRTTNYAGMGAYLSNFAPMIPTMAGTKVLASVYAFRAIYARVIGVFTHTVPVDAYRGAGRPESNYLVERLIDAAAREVGMDRAAIRRLNMVPPEAMPYRTPMNQHYDSGDFIRVLDAALAKIDWAGFPARQAAARRAGRRRGIGLAYYLEATAGQGTERAEIRFNPDGHVDVFVGTQSTGQGHETAYVMVVADRLGVDGGLVRVHQGDTDVIPIGGGTGGARSLVSEGTALVATTATIIERGREAAADALEVAVADIEFAEGQFRVAGTDRAIDILTLATRQREKAAIDASVPLLDVAEVAQVQAGTYPNGCHIAEVDADPETGDVRVVRYLVADDMGTVVNPMIVEGQIQGGVAQGVGQAFLERTEYDPDSGQLLTASFMDYALPRADDLPCIEVELIQVPCTTNPLGVKGAGEAGAVGSPPAAMNALIDALAADGVSGIDMPATPEKVWRALQAA
jgi:aerobic carbon-monoxide dehydrogenase large subunit